MFTSEEKDTEMIWRIIIGVKKTLNHKVLVFWNRG